MDRIEKKQVIGLLSVVIIAILSIYFYRHLMLKNTEETFAVFVEKNVGVGITQKKFSFKTIENEIVISSVVYSRKINIGDTVWIEYSISNPNVIRVLGSYPR